MSAPSLFIEDRSAEIVADRFGSDTVELTNEEWEAAIAFLTETGHACNRSLERAESTVPGPFHMVESPPRKPGEVIALDGKGEQCLVTHLGSEVVFGVKESLVRDFGEVDVDDPARAAELGFDNPYRAVHAGISLLSDDGQEAKR